MTSPEPRPPNTTPCYGETDLFFSPDYEDRTRAKAICETCLLRAPCLQRALKTSNSDPYTEGVAGGFDPLERGFYKRLYGTTVSSVQVLPERFRSKPPKRPGRPKAGAA